MQNLILPLSAPEPVWKRLRSNLLFARTRRLQHLVKNRASATLRYDNYESWQPVVRSRAAETTPSVENPALCKIFFGD